MTIKDPPCSHAAPDEAARARRREALGLAAARRCASLGEQFTPVRRRVLDLLADHRGPAKAYDLLDALRRDQPSAKPPTIYRALEFLVRAGLAHRVESLNAFMACEGGHAGAPAIMLICTCCGQAREAPAQAAVEEVQAAAAAAAFDIRQTVIEALGVCAQCRPNE